MRNLKVSHRMYLGFTAVVVLLAVAIGATLWKVSAIKQGTDRIVNLRTPTAQASARMTNDINASLATLRGWMLTGNPAFKADRALVWKDVADTRAAMDDLSKNWTNPKNVGIGHSSCLLAQRPSMGVMLGAQREARDGLRLPRDVLSACLSGWPLHPRAMLLLGGTQHGST